MAATSPVCRWVNDGDIRALANGTCEQLEAIILEWLKAECIEARVEVIGSLRKGTMLADHREIDLAVVLAQCSSVEQVLKVATSLSLFLRKHELEARDEGGWVRLVAKDMSADVVITADNVNLGPGEVGPSELRVRRFSVSLAQAELIGNLPVWKKHGIMVLKSWARQLRPPPSSYLFEVIAFNCLRDTEPCAEIAAAVKCCKWLVGLNAKETVRVREDGGRPTERTVRHNLPTILDPCDASNNLAETCVADWKQFVLFMNVHAGCETPSESV